MTRGQVVNTAAKSWINRTLVDIADKLTNLSTGGFVHIPLTSPNIHSIPCLMKKRTV